MELLNILFTSVGRRSYLVNYFKKALNGRGLIHAANSSDISPAFLEADRCVVTPMIYDENYIPFLLNYCKDNQITALISLFDIDIPVLAANKDKFLEIGTRVLVSDQYVAEICNDKWKTYKFLIEHGFHAPKTYLSFEEAKKAVEENTVTFPLFVKPRWGMGSIAVYEAENMEELSILYKKTLSSIKKSYLKYESSVDFGASVLIQEKVSGQEHGMDIINNLYGEYQNTIIKMKYAMRSGETDCAVTVEDPRLAELGKALSEKLKHIGNLDCDVFVDDECVTVLEMNARFGGGYPFSHLAGVNLPEAIVKWLSNEEVDPDLLKADIGVMGQKDIKIVRLR